MPTYCYTTNDGETVERVFGMTARHPTSITLEDGRTATRDFMAEQGCGKTPSMTTYPMTCMAAGIQPSQIAEATAFNKSVGLKTTYTSDGDAMFATRGQRAAHLKRWGMVDRDGGYGD